MGVVFVMGQCRGCGRLIHYNPHRVPSIKVEGEKQAICKNCHARWNEIHRTSKGLEPLAINPDAYEPIPEEEL